MARSEPAFELRAVHFDHQLDPGSAQRAHQAGRIAAQLGVEYELALPSSQGDASPQIAVGAKRSPLSVPQSRERLSPEEGARRLRYQALQQIAERTEAWCIATAHHREDQLNTILMRWLQGTGLRGLRGIDAVRGRIVRPVLDVPRTALLSVLESIDFRPVDDPTNRDWRLPRNRVDRWLRPALEAQLPDLPTRLIGVATAAGAAERTLHRRCLEKLQPRTTEDSVTVDRQRLMALPEALLGPAVRALHELVGARAAARGSVLAELTRQLRDHHAIGCDCGDGWSWSERNRRQPEDLDAGSLDAGDLDARDLDARPPRRYDSELILARRRPSTSAFEYTFELPGEVVVHELGIRLSLTPGPFAPWVTTGSRTRAGLAGNIRPGELATVRNRRPGDALQPLGFGKRKRLKQILIDRKVPRAARSSLPLLLIGEAIAWVPGITIDERFRVEETQNEVWIAQIRTA